VILRKPDKKIFKKERKKYGSPYFFKIQHQKTKNEIVKNFKAIKTQFRKLYATPNPENRKRFFT